MEARRTKARDGKMGFEGKECSRSIDKSSRVVGKDAIGL